MEEHVREALGHRGVLRVLVVRQPHQPLEEGAEDELVGRVVDGERVCSFLRVPARERGWESRVEGVFSTRRRGRE